MLHPVVYLILLCLCLQSASIVAAGDVETRNEVTSAGVKGPQLASLLALFTKGVSSPRELRGKIPTPRSSSPRRLTSHLHHLSKMHPNTTNNVEFITSREFITRICDYTYATRTAHNPLSVFVTQTADGPSYKCAPSEVLPTNSIICVRGDAKVVESFFTEGKCFQRAPYTLVSLETDDSSPFKAHWVHSKNLKKWYGWNAHANSGVIPIPIGLNSDSMLDPLRHARITPWTEKEHKVLLAFKSHTSERSKLNHIAKDLNFTASWSYKPTYKSAKTQLEMYESMTKFKYVFRVSCQHLFIASYLFTDPFSYHIKHAIQVRGMSCRNRG